MDLESTSPLEQPGVDAIQLEYDVLGVLEWRAGGSEPALKQYAPMIYKNMSCSTEWW